MSRFMTQQLISANDRTTSLRPRRGASIVELTVALFTLTVAAALVAQLAVTTARHRRHSEHRLVATQEAANALERMGQVAWEDLTADRFEQTKLSEVAAQALLDGQIEVRLTDIAEPRAGRRIDVTVSWAQDAAAERREVALSAWRFAP